jgi:hypothetical protein
MLRAHVWGLIPLFLVLLLAAFFVYAWHVTTCVTTQVPHYEVRRTSQSVLFARQRQIGALQYMWQNGLTPQVSVRQGVVQVRLYNLRWQSDAPFMALVLAIQLHPTSDLFRVTWKSYGHDSRSKSMALYNRHAHIVRFYGTGGDNTGMFFKRAVFRGVSDLLVREDAEEHEKSGGPYSKADEWEHVPMAFFDELPYYGCTGRDLPPTRSHFWIWQGSLWSASL